MKKFRFLTYQPFPYQLETIEFGIKHDNVGLILSMGLGKTYCAINIARYKIQYYDADSVLVVCPLVLVENWGEQIEKFSGFRPNLIEGTKDRKISLLNKNSEFYITNYESIIPRDYKDRISTEIFDTIIDKKFDILICDESSKYLSSPTSKTTESLIQISDNAEHRMILSGTLISNNPLGLWPQFRILDSGRTFGNNFYVFRHKCFNKLDFGRYTKYVIKQDYIPIINKAIYSTCIRFTKEECLKDLPDTMYSRLSIDGGKRFYIEYEKVKELIMPEIETELGRAKLNVKSILTKLIRLQQLTGGFTLDKNKNVKLVYTPKLDAISNDIENVIGNDESVIIWCRFIPSIRFLSKELTKRKIPHFVLFGGTKNKYDEWKGFQQSKNINVFIGQIESGGFGIELFKTENEQQKAQHMFFYENVWRPETRLQALDRNNRLGNKSKVLFYKDYCIKNTIDEYILDIVEGRQELNDFIISKKY